MPSPSDSNQVVVEQWETASDSSSHSLSLKMEENIAEHFTLLFSIYFSPFAIQRKTHLQAVLIYANE